MRIVVVLFDDRAKSVFDFPVAIERGQNLGKQIVCGTTAIGSLLFHIGFDVLEGLLGIVGLQVNAREVVLENAWLAASRFGGLLDGVDGEIRLACIEKRLA